MDLYRELDLFDGKHVDGLESLSTRLALNTETFDRLCAIAEEGEVRLQTAATWLLQRLMERGAELQPTQVGTLIELLLQVPHWQAKLHLLQTLPFLRLSKSHGASLERALLHCLDEPNKFVRAWSYNGMVELAHQQERYRSQVKALLKRAEKETAASIRARIRNAIKGRDWL